MANRIKIRHGSSAPTINDLLPFELGWDGDSLYIHNGKTSPDTDIVCIAGANAIITIPASRITGTSSGALYATSQGGVPSFGLLPVAQGGTGVSTTTANYVFAGPSGSNGAPTFRALTTTDIPSLSSVYLPLTGGNLTGNLSVSGAISANSATIDSCAVIRDSSTVSRKIFLAPAGTTTPPSGAVDGDIVLIKVS